MPTARPNITASSGVVEETVTRPVAAKIITTEIATPSTAVSSGIKAARSEPSVSSSTTRATSRPRASVMLKPGVSLLKASPPTEATAPGSFVETVAVSSSSPVRVAAWTVPSTRSSRTLMIAAESSGAIWPFAYLSKGPLTDSTPETSR